MTDRTTRERTSARDEDGRVADAHGFVLVALVVLLVTLASVLAR